MPKIFSAKKVFTQTVVSGNSASPAKPTCCARNDRTLPTLSKIKREATPHTNQTQVASHFILPKRTTTSFLTLNQWTN
jgi:hypothetical protein